MRKYFIPDRKESVSLNLFNLSGSVITSCHVFSPEGFVLHVTNDLLRFVCRYGRVESVKILPKRSAEGGRAAFVDFVDIRSATKAHESVNRIGDREMRTDYNEPGNPSNLSRLHADPPARPTSNSAPGSPVQRRRFDRRTEG